MKHLDAIYNSFRRKSREVKVGAIGIGDQNPIRIQSMTTSDTRDVQTTVDQIIRLADVGCEIVRLTVQGKKEAQSCEAIKNSLLQKGYTIPLVADIHFYPPAALLVAEFVEKVRINPGNFADRRASFKIIEYDDSTYALEQVKIEEAFAPLIEKCKKLSRALRIGTNHGSLSDRIMNRFGDTPKGMVESALEFARICRKYDYHSFVFSMKSSNPIVMIEAYRLLVSEMELLGWDYPLHLGVTEAGEGEDGRVKSAMGIGALLLDGIGDTIRVSLTEDPWNEIDPCKRIIRFFEEKQRLALHENLRRFAFKKSVPKIVPPLHDQASVFLKITHEDLLKESFFRDMGCKELGGLAKQMDTADAVWLDFLPENKESLAKLDLLSKIGVPFFTLESLYLIEGTARRNPQQSGEASLFEEGDLQSDSVDWQKIQRDSPSFILFHPTKSPIQEVRNFIFTMEQLGLHIPVILALNYSCSEEDLPIQAACEYGSLLCDKQIEGICLLYNPKEIPHSQSIRDIRDLSFRLLQAARMRTVRTDFISCPGCGRTLFNIQETSLRIRNKTAHLPGVKIAIMGCIVNGPGEMADADFGFVGSKSGKIDLYIGKTCVEKDIDFAEADQKLIDLIKAQGRWLEPETKMDL